jgi:manganese/zinc/iron transport system permease protein
LSELGALLTDYTVQTVLIAAVLLGIVSGVLGSFAVLRQQSLLGDALSHAALPGVCLGFMIAGTRSLPWILAGALVTGTLAALLILLLTRRSRLKTDASLGIALSLSFALGVVLLTHIQGQANAAQGGLDTFLFGQAAATLRSDLHLMGGITLAALLLVGALWKELKLVTFDPLFAGSIGLPVVLLEVVLTAMIALAVVVGLQMVGVVLMTAMVIAPAAAARQWARRLEHMVVLAAGVGVLSGVVGALLSATARGLATGPLIVLSASAIVLLSLLIAPGRGLVWAQVKRWRDSRALDDRRMLVTLYRLAAHHKQPAYPAERGALDSFHGLATRPALRRLERRGLAVRVRHMPNEGTHWELTPGGREAARRALADPTLDDPVIDRGESPALERA